MRVTINCTCSKLYDNVHFSLVLAFTLRHTRWLAEKIVLSSTMPRLFGETDKYLKVVDNGKYKKNVLIIPIVKLSLPNIPNSYRQKHIFIHCCCYSKTLQTIAILLSKNVSTDITANHIAKKISLKCQQLCEIKQEFYCRSLPLKLTFLDDVLVFASFYYRIVSITFHVCTIGD